MFKKKPKSRDDHKSVGCRRIEANLSAIISALKTNKSARDSLILRLHNQQWIDIGDELSPKELMKVVLCRIERNASDYDAFISVLSSVTGLESIASRIQETHVKREQLQYKNISDRVGSTRHAIPRALPL